MCMHTPDQDRFLQGNLLRSCYPPTPTRTCYAPQQKALPATERFRSCNVPRDRALPSTMSVSRPHLCTQRRTTTVVRPAKPNAEATAPPCLNSICQRAGVRMARHVPTERYHVYPAVSWGSVSATSSIAAALAVRTRGSPKSTASTSQRRSMTSAARVTYISLANNSLTRDPRSIRLVLNPPIHSSCQL
jgi:hypothetical protein